MYDILTLYCWYMVNKNDAMDIPDRPSNDAALQR